jgi:soluble lytic murein transglycosylase
MKYPDSLEINFTVESSQGRGNEIHTSNNGDFLAFRGGYRVGIQFINFGSFAPPNFLSLPLSQQVTYLKEIFDKADIKVKCDCPAHYFQGNWELLDRNPPDASKEQFSGQFGKGIWDAIHNTKNRICKHTYHVLEELDQYIPKIIKSLNKSTSMQIPVQPPSQPAGQPATPGPGVPKTTTVNSEKIDVEKDEKESSAEALNLPTMDTTDVKAKSHEDESDAVSGEEDAEPPIEEIPVAKKPEEEEDLEEELPESKLEEKLLSFTEIMEKTRPLSLKEAVEIVFTNKNKSGRILEAFRVLERLEPFTDPEYYALQDAMDKNGELLNFLTNMVRRLPEKYQYLMPKEMGKNHSLIDFINRYGRSNNPCLHNYFVKDGEKFLGFIFYQEDDNNPDIVEDAGVFDFNIKETSNEKMKDLINFPKNLLKTHSEVNWFVYDGNPAKRTYDIYIKKHGGTSWVEPGKTVYRIKKEEFRENLRELQLRSQEDYALWKEWKKSGASEVITFEQYKDIQDKPLKHDTVDLKTVLARSRAANMALNEAVFSSPKFQKLNEVDKIKLLKKLFAAGLISASALGTISMRDIPKEIPTAIVQQEEPEIEIPKESHEERYEYKDPEIGESIEKYRGDIEPQVIEAFLQTESKYGKDMKWDSQGAGIAQVSKIAVDHYNSVNGTDYDHEDVFYDDDLNIKIGCWFLNWCKQYAKNRGIDADDIDLYLMYNNGANGYIKNTSKYRNPEFRPYVNYLKAREEFDV